MLGLVGVIFAEQSTGISWVDAGKVLNEQPSYLGFNINVPLKTLVLIEVLAMGFAEVKRSAGTSPNASSGTARKVLLSRCLFSSSRHVRRSFARASDRKSAGRSVSRFCSDVFHPSRKKNRTELDSEKRSYPGGYFDPLKFADTTSDEALFKLKTAELKHGRLAMVGMLGIAVQATKNGEGALEALRSVGN
jgi:hypothetical protein